MKVFISWSGDASRDTAEILRDWLPSVVQSLDTYVSSEDINKGARWATEIAKELGESEFGILCITKENLDAPWLNFEAGALSWRVGEKAHVAPFLLDLAPDDLGDSPLRQFQATTVNETEVLKLLRSINEACSDSLEDTRLVRTFSQWWPELEERLSSIQMPSGTGGRIPSTSVTEMLEQVLDLVRSQHRMLSDPEVLLPPDYMARFTRVQRAALSRVPVQLIAELHEALALVTAVSQTSAPELASAVDLMRPALRYLDHNFGVHSRTALAHEGPRPSDAERRRLRERLHQMQTRVDGEAKVDA